jgi:predicted amidophosphoribosyltransferase
MNCGSAFSFQSTLCSQCRKFLVNCFGSDSELNIRGKKLISLMIWNPNQSDLLSNLILRLKSSEDKTWSYFAQEFLLNNHVEILNSSILISLASEKGKFHGQMWGQSLSELTGIPHRMGLSKIQGQNETHQQKQKNRSQRQALELQLNVDISELENKKVIFVDDVVTTGATLLAAHKALGDPVNFECWSLCYRNPLSIAKSKTK